MRRILALLLLAPLAAFAQSPITIVVNFGAGAANDVAGRLIAQEWTQSLGQPVIVKNTTGASGTLGALEVARARPDGLTLLLSTVGPITVQPHFMRNAGYTMRDLVPICQVTDAALVLQTTQTSGMRTLADLAARARAERGDMPYGSSGPGTLTHLAVVAWLRSAGLQMQHIPFRTPGDVMLAFAQGSILVFADQPATIRPNNLHPLAVFAPARLAEFPEAPTMRELGHAIDMSIWQGFFAPVGTPAPTLARFEAACAQVTQGAPLRQGMDRIQTPVVYRNGRDFAAMIAQDSERMRSMIEAGNLRAAE